MTMISFTSLPETVLVQILSHLPAKYLITVVRMVCKQWRELIDGSSLWVIKCQREGLIPKNIRRSPKDWRTFYILSSLKRNLIKNPSAKEDFDHWHIARRGQHKWRIETLPAECRMMLSDERVEKYFVTSFWESQKEQLIDLQEEGYWSELVDNVNPPIVVTDWYAARTDCGCRYEMCVQLLSQFHGVLHEFRPERLILQQCSDSEWRQMTHTFRNYGVGVRYIRFVHGGRDTQFWGGLYGIRVTNSKVVIEPEDLT
ncbi:F-box only protein 44-like isoform X2 [Protopterus annectens]|nr:F-box only protein 44-like isoform X2 [Protopterus annectens]XP_043917711.1 F-box only protein 44-like isoform X2 [Protopterus annectens]